MHTPLRFFAALLLALVALFPAIPALADLQPIGITGAVFSSQVLDKTAWESKYGTGTDPLKRAELPSTGTPPAPETWVPFTSPAGGFSIWAPSFIATPVAPGQPN